MVGFYILYNMNDIETFNSKGEHHGYQEWYCYTTYTIHSRCVYKNGFEIGYDEWHSAKTTRFFIR